MDYLRWQGGGGGVITLVGSPVTSYLSVSDSRLSRWPCFVVKVQF